MVPDAGSRGPPAVSCEILRLDLKGTQWRSKLSECSVDALCIAGVGADQHVHVLGSTWMAVKCNCMASNEHELRSYICQLILPCSHILLIQKDILPI